MKQFIFLRTNLFYALCILFSNYSLYSQWNITTNQKNVIEIYDLLAFQNQEDFENGYNFFGAMWGPTENVVHTGIVFKKQKREKKVKGLSSQKNVFLWKLDGLNKPIEVLSKNTILYLNSFITGYQGYIIYLNDGIDWYKIEIQVEFSGYQIPEEFLLTKFRSSSGKLQIPVILTTQFQFKLTT